MQMSEQGKNLLKQWEGFKNHVYLDSGGAPTIGIGHLLTLAERRAGKIIINGVAVRYGNGLSAQQIMDLLAQDLMPVENAVNNGVKVELAQHQFDALVSFAFNVGIPAFLGSTLLRSLNADLYGRVPDQLKRWVHDNGKVVQGLVNRRNKEINVWLNGYTSSQH